MVVNKEVDNRAVKQGVFKQVLLARKSVMGFNKLLLLRTLIAVIYNKKNNLLSAVVSDNVINYVEHLVEYLSCRVFG